MAFLASPLFSRERPLSPTSSPYPVRAWPLPGPEGGLPPACLIEFNSADFGPAAFQAQAIDCPASIARSVRKRQAEFFYGRLAARHAMEAQRITPATIAIGAAREPLWPDGVIGSITHNNHCAIALALRRGRWSGVGIDIETVVQPDMQAAMLSGVVTPVELALLRALDTPLSFELLLTIVFSAKESLFKGAYGSVGSYFDFSAAELCAVHSGPGPRSVTLRLTQTLSRDFILGTEHRVYVDFPQGDSVLTCFAW